MDEKIIVFIDQETITEDELLNGDNYEPDDERVSGENCRHE